MFQRQDFEELADYAVTFLGPLLNGYFAALDDHCRTNNVGMVGFVSREGVFLQRAFEAFCAARGLSIPSVHIAASRAFLQRLLLNTGSLDIVGRETFKGTVARLFADRFAIYEWTDDSAVNAWAHLEVDLPNDKAKVASIWSVVRHAIAPSIDKERAAYEAYLSHSGIDERALLADVGYSGSLQALLGEMLGRPVNGYYIATSTKQVRYSRPAGGFGALFPAIGRVGEGPAVLNNSMLLEIMMSADHGQIDSYQDGGGALPWAFKSGPLGKAQYGFAIIKIMQDAAIGYLEETRDVPIETLCGADHRAWLFEYVNRLMTMPAMAPRLLVAIGDADDRFSGLGFINPWTYLRKFR